MAAEKPVFFLSTMPAVFKKAVEGIETLRYFTVHHDCVRFHSHQSDGRTDMTGVGGWQNDAYQVLSWSETDRGQDQEPRPITGEVKVVFICGNNEQTVYLAQRMYWPTCADDERLYT